MVKPLVSGCHCRFQSLFIWKFFRRVSTGCGFAGHIALPSSLFGRLGELVGIVDVVQM